MCVCVCVRERESERERKKERIAHLTPFVLCAACDPTADPMCSLIVGPTSYTYMANLELFTLKIDHSVSAEEFNLFQSSQEMHSDGILTTDGKRIDICKGEATGETGPPTPRMRLTIHELL